MSLSDSRQHALFLTKNFVEAISMTTGKKIDFYKMLWIMHWSIDAYGKERTREVLEELILSPGFEPERSPEQLRDLLLKRALEEDAVSAWFKRAIANHQSRLK